jgi:hypothetical protein
MVVESQGEYRSQWQAIESVCVKLGIGSPETLRKWLRRTEIDVGQRLSVRCRAPPSRRRTNGWWFWSLPDGRRLKDLRAEYVAQTEVH